MGFRGYIFIRVGAVDNVKEVADELFIDSFNGNVSVRSFIAPYLNGLRCGAKLFCKWVISHLPKLCFWHKPYSLLQKNSVFTILALEY